MTEVQIEFIERLTSRPSTFMREMRNLFKRDDMVDVLRYAIENKFFDVISSDFYRMSTVMQKNEYHNETVLEHTLEVMQYIYNTVDHDDLYYNYIMFAALLHDIGKVNTLSVDDKGITHFYGHEEESVKIFKSFAKQLFFYNAEIDIISFMIVRHMDTKCFGDGNFTRKRYKCIRRLMAECGSKTLFRAYEKLCDADVAAMHKVKSADEIEWVAKLHALTREIENTEPDYYEMTQFVTIEDIMELRSCSKDTAKLYMDYLNRMKIGNYHQTDTKEKCIKLILGAKI